MTSKNSVKWFIAYESLSKSLADFYHKCKRDGDDPAQIAHSKLVADSDFRKENDWFNKFALNSEMKSVDPLHLFSSINSNKSSNESRIKRLNILLKIFGGNGDFLDIDYVGCPAIMNLKLLSNRSKNHQDEIWELLYDVNYSKPFSLNNKTFLKYKKWYGVDFVSFTIFLFWIDSDNFISFDQYTSTFLLASNIIQSIPKNGKSYMNVLEIIGSYNYSSNVVFGSKGIYREVVSLAYQIVGEGKTDIVFTTSFNNLINEKKNNIEQNVEKNELLVAGDDILETENFHKALSQSISLGFRIIALRILKDDDENIKPEYLNNLEENTFYYFEKAFEISDNEVLYDPQKNIRLFDQKVGINDKLNVNVTAIVGKNGSGKSSIADVFYRIINNYAYSQRNRLKIKDLIPVKNVHAELYYILDGELFCLKVNNESVFFERFMFNGTKFIKQRIDKQLSVGSFTSMFFTIAVNYSHYALNSVSIGRWIKELFHKNDGYQTPLVLNPFRTEGNININSENDLVRYRLIANILYPHSENLDIAVINEKQFVHGVQFFLDKGKCNTLYRKWEKGNRFKNVPYRSLKNKDQILNQIFNKFKIKKSNIVRCQSSIEAKRYILCKLVKIATTYAKYKKYFDEKEVLFFPDSFDNYIEILFKDESHITYKLRQAINFLKYPKLISKEDSFIIDVKNKREEYGYFLSEHQDESLLTLLPPPIYKSEILMKSINPEETRLFSFDKLSSGEKQIIHSVNSIIYHIRNIDSISEKDTSFIGYQNVNLLLDEIELYYHPEMQRIYLNYLLKMIGSLSLSRVKAVNIMIVTHSPYILSDIPDFYTLKLENGLPVDKEFKTFGANIHDLLANEFFMKDGFMGEFAKEKIKNVISSLQYVKLTNQLNEITEKVSLTDEQKNKKLGLQNELEELEKVTKVDKTECEQIIRIIGEPVLYQSLMELYAEAYPDNKENFIEAQIEFLTQLKSKK